MSWSNEVSKQNQVRNIQVESTSPSAIQKSDMNNGNEWWELFLTASLQMHFVNAISAWLERSLCLVCCNHVPMMSIRPYGFWNLKNFAKSNAFKRNKHRPFTCNKRKMNRWCCLVSSTTTQLFQVIQVNMAALVYYSEKLLFKEFRWDCLKNIC